MGDFSGMMLNFLDWSTTTYSFYLPTTGYSSTTGEYTADAYATASQTGVQGVFYEAGNRELQLSEKLGTDIDGVIHFRVADLLTKPNDQSKITDSNSRDWSVVHAEDVGNQGEVYRVYVKFYRNING